MDKLCAYEHERNLMVSRQIERRGVHDERLLEAFRNVPRHLFVPKNQRHNAYDDYPLRIGLGQTISQPYIVALMTNLLGLKGDENVLEVGTGSGYQAAILAKMADTVHTVERFSELAERAGEQLEALAFNNVHVHVADGSLGWKEHAPYDGILVTAAAPSTPKPLLDQLAEDGRMVIPVGDRFMQDLQVWQRDGDDFSCERVIAVAFVPLRGTHGWQEDEWG
jgi:protein-L-isoaspartate(D-aspartate) O-methyltransferase